MFIVNPLFVYLIATISECLAFAPSWESLDSRQTPAWYDKAKIGIFIHWGVYSVPAHTGEFFWWYLQGETPPKNAAAQDLMRKRYHSLWTYADFAPDFTCELYDPKTWAELLRSSGARYVVLTAKHHEGFAMWPSTKSPGWNSMDVGPRRDLVGDLAEACRAAGMKFGVYYSLPEWFNGMWRKDKAAAFTQNTYSRFKVQPELRDLAMRYKPDLIWVDGEGAPDTYWNSTGFLAWLYNQSPVAANVVVNDKWGTGISCKHGDFFNCGEKFNPGHLFPHKFENVLSLDKLSWGYRRTMILEDVMSIEELLLQVVSTVACNGNVLISIGARRDGTFPAIFEERLRQLGRWLAVNQEAIFETTPWIHPQDTKNRDVWYTMKPSTIYVFITRWPGKRLELGTINTGLVKSITQIKLLGQTPTIQRFILSEHGLTVELPCVTCAQPLDWVWVLKLIC